MTDFRIDTLQRLSGLSRQAAFGCFCIFASDLLAFCFFKGNAIHEVSDKSSQPFSHPFTSAVVRASFCGQLPLVGISSGMHDLQTLYAFFSLPARRILQRFFFFASLDTGREPQNDKIGPLLTRLQSLHSSW